MIDIKDNYCVILAGGLGRRLWPCSRKNLPKQFIDFFGTGSTALQQTFERFAKILPQQNIYVITNEMYVDIVKQQLPDVNDDNILGEPIHRNTAPSIAWAAHHISHINPQANIIVSPSDQLVINEENFKRDVLEGLEFITGNDRLLTMGVKPTRPEPGYGYIQIGEAADKKDFWSVKSFTEKPERDFAKMFMESGEFYWNTGLFLCQASSVLHSFESLLPVVLRQLDKENPNFTLEQERQFVKENYPLYPNVSLDYGILEKASNVYVMRCDFGWADLGTWHSIYEQMDKDSENNVIIDSNVIIDNSRNNIVKISEGKMAVINGLDGYIVAEKDNVLVICKKGDSSALIRKYVNEVQMKLGEDFV